MCSAKGTEGTKAWKQDQSVCFVHRNSNTKMEQDQRETGDKEDSLEWAEDLEVTGQVEARIQSYKATWLLMTL